MATTYDQIELSGNWQSLGDLLGGVDFSTHRALIQCDTHSVWAIAYSQSQPDDALRGHVRHAPGGLPDELTFGPLETAAEKVWVRAVGGQPVKLTVTTVGV